MRTFTHTWRGVTGESHRLQLHLWTDEKVPAVSLPEGVHDGPRRIVRAWLEECEKHEGDCYELLATHIAGALRGAAYAVAAEREAKHKQLLAALGKIADWAYDNSVGDCSPLGKIAADIRQLMNDHAQ